MDELALLKQQTAEIVGMDMKFRIARSFAASYRWNSRNLEAHWYGRSSQVWQDLVKPFPNIIVVPQYPLWYIDETADDEQSMDDEEAGSGCEEWDSDEVEVRDPGGNQPGENETTTNIDSDDDDQNCVQEDFSEATMFTIPGSNATELIHDFVILHFRTQPL
jgi:hypothetical protein